MCVVRTRHHATRRSELLIADLAGLESDPYGSDSRPAKNAGFDSRYAKNEILDIRIGEDVATFKNTNVQHRDENPDCRTAVVQRGNSVCVSTFDNYPQPRYIHTLIHTYTQKYFIHSYTHIHTYAYIRTVY